MPFVLYALFAIPMLSLVIGIALPNIDEYRKGVDRDSA
jgi:hypothetical protein